MHIALCNHDSSKNFERDRDWTAVWWLGLRPREKPDIFIMQQICLWTDPACMLVCCCQAIRRKRQRERVSGLLVQHEETSVCPVYALCISIDEIDDFEGSMLSCETFFFIFYFLFLYRRDSSYHSSRLHGSHTYYQVHTPQSVLNIIAASFSQSTWRIP